MDKKRGTILLIWISAKMLLGKGESARRVYSKKLKSAENSFSIGLKIQLFSWKEEKMANISWLLISRKLPITLKSTMRSSLLKMNLEKKEGKIRAAFLPKETDLESITKLKNKLILKMKRMKKIQVIFNWMKRNKVLIVWK